MLLRMPTCAYLLCDPYNKAALLEYDGFGLFFFLSTFLSFLFFFLSLLQAKQSSQRLKVEISVRLNVTTHACTLARAGLHFQDVFSLDKMQILLVI